jgi:hypothetical protein
VLQYRQTLLDNIPFMPPNSVNNQRRKPARLVPLIVLRARRKHRDLDNDDRDRRPLAFLVVLARLIHRWRGPTFGLVVGFLAWLALSLTFQDRLVLNFIGPGVAIVCGIAVGAAIDWLEEQRKS